MADKLEAFLASRHIPNLILHGPSGAGKRTLLRDFLRRVYGGDPAVLKTNVMVVNCSHGNKGIRFIRDEFKFFAKTNLQSNYGVPFKSIVMLNADCLTIDAQTALRRCIELFSHSTRFFIVVKDKQRLLNPILSRFCAIYVPLPLSLPIPVGAGASATNLHQRHLADTFAGLPQSTLASLTYPSGTKNEAEAEARLLDLATQLYERGESALDLVASIDQNQDQDREHLNLATMCFYKIKGDIRHEKWLLFYVLFFVHMCSKTDLKNLLLV